MLSVNHYHYLKLTLSQADHCHCLEKEGVLLVTLFCLCNLTHYVFVSVYAEYQLCVCSYEGQLSLCFSSFLK